MTKNPSTSALRRNAAGLMPDGVLCEPSLFISRVLLEYSYKCVIIEELQLSRDGVMPFSTAGLSSSPDTNAKLFLALE